MGGGCFVQRVAAFMGIISGPVSADVSVTVRDGTGPGPLFCSLSVQWGTAFVSATLCGDVGGVGGVADGVISDCRELSLIFVLMVCSLSRRRAFDRRRRATTAPGNT